MSASSSTRKMVGRTGHSIEARVTGVLQPESRKMGAKRRARHPRRIARRKLSVVWKLAERLARLGPILILFRNPEFTESIRSRRIRVNVRTSWGQLLECSKNAGQNGSLSLRTTG